jgi:hypothetical protein
MNMQKELSKQARDVARKVLTKKYGGLVPITREMVDALARQIEIEL